MIPSFLQHTHQQLKLLQVSSVSSCFCCIIDICVYIYIVGTTTCKEYSIYISYYILYQW